MTTKLLILAAAFVLCGAVELPEYKPGRLVSRGVNSRALEDANAQCALKADGTYCSSNNCETALLCYGSGSGVEIPCDSSVRYCDDEIDRCTSIKPKTCPDTKTDFVCKMKGYFPDPTNCELFYYCYADLTIDPEVYDCGPGYAVDINVRACKKRNFPSDCAIINCTEANKVVTYAPNPAYFAICVKTGDKLVPTITKCPDHIYHAYSYTKPGCELVCKAEGNQEDAEDCHKYYTCSKSGGKWDYRSYSCLPHPRPDGPAPNNLITFNPVTKKCDANLPSTCIHAVDK